MSDWENMAKRLRKNQEKNLSDFAKQSSIADRRIGFLNRIQNEKATVLSNSRRKQKQNFETPHQTKSVELDR